MNEIYSKLRLSISSTFLLVYELKFDHSKILKHGTIIIFLPEEWFVRISIEPMEKYTNNKQNST